MSLYFALVTVAALMMAGMVIDGGKALSTRERAADLATQAARAGADALTPASLRNFPGGGALQADPAAAQAAADRVLSASGATGVVSVEGSTVTVRATVQAHTAILSAVSLTDISQSATATATAIYGGTTQEGG